METAFGSLSWGARPPKAIARGADNGWRFLDALRPPRILKHRILAEEFAPLRHSHIINRQNTVFEVLFPTQHSMQEVRCWTFILFRLDHCIGQINQFACDCPEAPPYFSL